MLQPDLHVVDVHFTHAAQDDRNGEVVHAPQEIRIGTVGEAEFQGFLPKIVHFPLVAVDDPFGPGVKAAADLDLAFPGNRNVQRHLVVGGLQDEGGPPAPGGNVPVGVVVGEGQDAVFQTVLDLAGGRRRPVFRQSAVFDGFPLFGNMIFFGRYLPHSLAQSHDAQPRFRNERAVEGLIPGVVSFSRGDGKTDLKPDLFRLPGALAQIAEGDEKIRFPDLSPAAGNIMPLAVPLRVFDLLAVPEENFRIVA